MQQPLDGKYEVKLGRSFQENSPATFMTMRCDFLPASVDRTKPGKLTLTDEKEVSVVLPNVSSAAPGVTFRGNVRPVQKECILVHNKRTGEFTLERISRAAQLKQTREERTLEPASTSQPATASARAFGKSAPRTMSESSSDETSTLAKPRISEVTGPRQQQKARDLASFKTRKLSSSSSSSNTGFGDLSSLSSDDEKPSDGEKRTLKAKQKTPLKPTTQASVPSMAALAPVRASFNTEVMHKSLMDHGLHLSESDSESC